MVIYNYYKLKNQYRLGVANNCNYILSDQGEECVYLNPYVAFVLNRLFTGSSVEDVASVLSAINCFSIEKATEVVLKIVQRLANYIEPSHTLSITKTEDEIDILNRSKTFLCPVTKEKAPRKIKFYLTDYCPRRCIYCFAGAKFTNELIENKEFLSVDRFKEIIMEAAAIGVSNIEFIISWILIGVFMIVMAKAVFIDVITIGLFISMVNNIIDLNTCVNSTLSSLAIKIAQTKSFICDLNDFCKYTYNENMLVEPAEKVHFETLEFKNVSFNYPGSDRIILNNISFKIETGKSYAFIGENGSGKSTIIKLIIGLYKYLCNSFLLAKQCSFKHRTHFI